MNILGVNIGHDPSAAILIDGKIIAAVDEERFTREKHAPGKTPVNAIKFCIEKAQIKPEDINAIAFPYSLSNYRQHKWRFARRVFAISASKAINAILKDDYEYKRMKVLLNNCLRQNEINPKASEMHFVEHHMAHASSAHHLSGFEHAAIMSIDGAGEFTCTLFAEGSRSGIKKIKEFIYPDSLGFFYSTITEYLGFKINNGEYKVMGMAPYGNAKKLDLSDMLRSSNGSYSVNNDYVWVRKSHRYKKKKIFSKKMVDQWGPPRKGEGLTEPYIHIAASAQKMLEDITLTLMETYLAKTLKENGGRLCFAGGCALNVSLNRKLIEHPLVKELFIQPASHDSGTALGAATYVANQMGEKIEPMKHVYYGPSYSNDEIRQLLDKYKLPYTYSKQITDIASTLLAEGKILAWFQGAMEYGPRALGNRSILANPSVPGISDEINQRIKFREKWRPFCPSILPEYAKEILAQDHPAPYMTIGFDVTPEWKERIKEAVHVNNTLRPQVVDPETNPKFYNLLKEFHNKTKLPVLINTSLNRRGEPMVCSPQDAINMFYGSGLEYMILGNYLVKK